MEFQEKILLEIYWPLILAMKYMHIWSKIEKNVIFGLLVLCFATVIV